MTPLASRHLQTGWWLLVAFMALGLTLEALHAFKLTWYLGAPSETRRLMMTLGHAHGALMGLLNIGFAATLGLHPELARQRLASRLLLAGSALLPGGFLLGAFGVHNTDPGLAVLLAPVGAFAAIAAAVLVAAGLRR